MRCLAGPLLGIAIALLAGCSPELAETPFACGAEGLCPDGYECQSTVCVKSGERLPAARPARVAWINSAEMYWFAAKGGGAALVYNDGFTPGAHGLYELVVGADGGVSEPRALLGYGDEFPVSSAIVPLDDGRYGAATLRFPDVEGDALTLRVLGVEREAPADRAPTIDLLYEDHEPYLGGTEPAYIGAVADAGAIDVAWTRPAQGGRVEVVHLEGASATRKGERSLPEEILPLSGDCLLWPGNAGARTLRIGFEQFAVAKVDGASAVSEFAIFDDVPLFAWGSEILLLRYGDEDGSGGYAVSYARASLDGADLGVDEGFALQGSLEPYTGVPWKNGALIAPIARDPSFATLGVGFAEPGKPLTTIASIPRPGTDELYSARAFVSGDKVYLAWTEFHEALMDLWVAVTDLGAGGEAASHVDARTKVQRVLSLPATKPALRRRPSRSAR